MIILKKNKRKFISLCLVLILVISAFPSIFLSSFSVNASGVDVSNSDELLFDYSNYNFVVTTDDNKTFNLPYNSSTNTYDWPSDTSVASVTEFSGRLMFSLADNREEIVNGTYFTYKLPELFSLIDTSAKDVIIKVGESEYVLGQYSIADNTIRMDFQSDLLGHEGISISNVSIPFIADIDKTRLGTSDNDLYPISDPNKSPVSYIEIPKAPTELSTITKTAEVQDDNSVKWTIEIGASKDVGVSLAGATIQEVLDGNQDFVKAYLGTNPSNTIDFEVDSNNENLYTYTFPTNSTLTATQTLTVITNPKSDVISPLSGVDNDVVLSNTVRYIAQGKTESEALSASDTATIKRTSLGKAGTVIDGNTIEWNLDLNHNLANVYQASVVDPLSKGLTVDEEYGIIITDKSDENKSCTLTSGKKSGTVGSVNVSYNITESAGKQTISVDFGTFNHEYDVCFRTKVSNEDFQGDAQVDNTAHVDVSYPKGSGSGGSSSITYGSPDINMNFYNSHIKIESTSEADAHSTGVLNWKVTPSTKMDANDYTGGVMTLSIGEGQSFTGGNASSVRVYNSKNEEVSSDYTASVSGNVLTINFGSSVDLDDVYVLFDTRADSYFTDDDKHTYTANADLTLTTGSGNYNAQQSTAKQILQNSMVKKTVTTSFDDENNRTLFTFNIKINNKGLPLTNVNLSDNLSGIFKYTDMSKVDSKGNVIANDSDGSLEDGDYEILNVTSQNGGVVSYDNASKTANVTYDSLNTSDTITIVLDLTSQGKDKLKLGGVLSEKIIYASNSATLTASELDDDGITGSVKGLAGSQIAMNKSAVKNGAQYKTGNVYTADIDWVVDINSMGASLGTNPSITDTIPNGLTLDKNSVTLYLAKHGDSGTDIIGTKVAVDSNSYSFSAVKGRDGKTVLTINLPTDPEYSDASYRLTYTTSMSGGVATYQNELELDVDDATCDVEGTVVGKNISYGYGTIRSFLTMTKTDSLSDSIKVKGAKYGIFKTQADAETGDESKTIDVGYTDDNGQFTFTVPGELKESNAKTYYVREIKAPITSDGNGGGYAIDTNVYTISGVTYGKHNIGPDGIDSTKSFVDKRETGSVLTGDVSLTNTFINDGFGGNSSQFKLYVNPYGNEKKEVALNKTAEGVYSFNEFTTGTTITGTSSEVSGSNSISKINITGLPWGTYKLIQTVPANGYIKASEITFIVSQRTDGSGCDVTGVTNVDNTKTKLVVKDNVAADYILKENGTNRTWNLSGDDLLSGITLENELIQGKSYTISQTSVPSGYKSHANVSVNNFNGNQTVNITESPIVGNVVVKNQDGMVINDATLSMTDNTNTTISGTSLDLNKKVNVSGSYEITGTLPDRYMPIDLEKVTVNVNSSGNGFTVSSSNASVMNASVSGTTITVTVQEIRSKVNIIEVSEDDDTTILTGGSYTLYNASDNSVVPGYSDIENVDGIDISYLTIGDYYIMQNAAPNAYGIIDSNKKYEFSVDSSVHNSVIPITVKNHPLPGTINVTKTTPDGSKSLSGGVYKLYKKVGTDYVEVQSGTTDANGNITFSNLLWDTYYLKEVKAPAGYQLDDTMYGGWTINAQTPNQTLDKTVSDNATSVQIKTQGINILDGSDEENAQVELIGEGLLSNSMAYDVTGIFAGDNEVSTKTFTDDNKDGLIDVKNEFVVGNTYTFTQKSVINPYNKVDSFDVDITEEIGKTNKSIDVTNRMNRVSFVLTDADGMRLPGGVFKLIDSNNNVVKDNLESKGLLTGGTLEITGLVPGEYTLVETSAPHIGAVDETYYALDSSGLKFKLNNDNTVKVLSINKDAKNQKALGKANNTTNVNSVLGVANSASIADSAVLTYVNTPTELAFNVNVRYNEDCHEDSGASSNMGGITYGIYNDSKCDDSDLIKEVTSNKEGEVKVLGLPSDTYYVKMLSSTGSNVVIDDNIYVAEVDSSQFEGLRFTNGSYVDSSNVQLEVYRQDIKLQKADREDNSITIAGSTYGLYRKSSISVNDITHLNESNNKLVSSGTSNNASNEWSLVASSITDEDGNIVFDGVDVGLIYMIKEIESPNGYQVSKHPIYVRFVRGDDGTITLETIDDADGTASVSEDGSITWYEPRIKVAVEVVDEDNNVVSGTSLKLVCLTTNNDIRNWVSSNEQELIEGILRTGGKYSIVGLEVPDGYEQPDDVTFTVYSVPLGANEDYTQVIRMVVRKSKADSGNTVAEANSVVNNSYSELKPNSNSVKSPKTGEKGILTKLFNI